MPIGIFKRVYAVSSEDPNFQAKNLLKIEAGKKWKTKNKGEKLAYVVLQFEEAEKITSIDIGNEHSAFIEVLVGKNTSSQDDFKEILITSSFMTPPESKNSINPNRVRCFPKEKLVQSVAEEKWDLVKVICTQPFNKNVQYGLSFITVRVEKESKPSVSENFLKNSVELLSSSLPSDKKQKEINLKLFGSFKLREDSPESDPENSSFLFKRWKQTKNAENCTKTSTATLIRNASTSSSLKEHYDNFKPSVKVINKKEKRTEDNIQVKLKDKPVLDRNRNDILFEKEDDASNEKLERKILLDKERFEKENDNKNKKKTTENNKPNSKEIKNTKFGSKDIDKNKTSAIKDSNNEKVLKQSDNNIHKRPSYSTTEQSPKTKKSKTDELNEKPKEYKPFNKLLEGVVLVISGIQNPDRGEIRRKALEMGAKYKPDWDNTCTYLICAFKNTPKYNQVKSKGKIVTRYWIEKCYSLRKRLPWRRYAMEDKDIEQSESENEIYDISLKPNIEENTNNENCCIEISENEKNEISKNISISKDNINESQLTSESDTEDELEKIRYLQKSKHEVFKSVLEFQINNKLDLNSTNIYDVSTEEEEITKCIKKTNSRNDVEENVKNFFNKLKFFIGNVGAVDEIKLKHFITAYSGTITSSLDEANYVITNEPIECSSKFKGEMVTPLWIYECNDMECLIPTKRYLI